MWAKTRHILVMKLLLAYRHVKSEGATSEDFDGLFT
jgi:hypothetical protein